MIRVSRALPMIVFCGRSAVATILLYTGLIHAAQPYLFIYTFSAYQIVSTVVAGIAGLILPYLHIALASCIFSRVADFAALVISALLFGMYALAQSIVLLKGASIECGCFGYSGRQVSWASAALAFALGVLSIWLSYASANVGDRVAADEALAS